MSLLEALLLGVVQGLTEFLPISSSGHLILVPWIQDYGFLRDHDAFNRTFDVALHAGTLVAVLVYFRRDLLAILRGFFRTVRARSIEDVEGRLAWVILVGTIPAILIGGAAGDWIDNHLAEPWLIGILLAVFGLVLWHADTAPQRRKVEDAKLRDGLIIGVAQAIALAPGTSRSGITITAARYLGLDRDSAARLSFLLLVPAVAGATVLKSYDAIHKGFPHGVAGPMIVGTIAAGVSGYAAIAALLAFVRRNSYRPFVFYRLAVAAGVGLLILTGIRSTTF